MPPRKNNRFRKPARGGGHKFTNPRQLAAAKNTEEEVSSEEESDEQKEKSNKGSSSKGNKNSQESDNDVSDEDEDDDDEVRVFNKRDLNFFFNLIRVEINLTHLF